MFVPALRRPLVRTGLLYNARTDGRKAGQGIPALRTDAALARPDAPLVRADAPLVRADAPPARPDAPPARPDAPPARPDAPPARQATTMPVKISFGMRESIRAGSRPIALIKANSRAGFFVIEIASSSDAPELSIDEADRGM
jgi:hypothetical protein